MSTFASLSLASLFLAAAIALPLGGCSKPAGDAATEAALRAATGHDVGGNRGGEQTNIRTGSRERRGAGDEIALPDDFPADVYLPANRHIRSVMDIDDARLVSMTTAGNPAALQDEASTSMRAKGWRQVMVMAHEEARMLSFQKDHRAATMTLIPADDGQVQFNVQLAAL